MSPRLVDPSLLERISHALRHSPHLRNRSALRFETRGDQVTLRGTVRSYYQKQMAQETLKQLPGIARVDNLLEVSGV